MTDFFEFMFRDAPTAWGMGIFIVIINYTIVAGIRDMIRYGRRERDDD